MSRFGHDLLEAAREALAIAKGEAVPPRVIGVHDAGLDRRPKDLIAPVTSRTHLRRSANKEP